MKFLDIAEFTQINGALNFSTADCYVVGACDIYTTKAAGDDRKLYREIENTLEAQYASLVRFSASLSPPFRAGGDADQVSSEENGNGTTSDRDRDRDRRGNSVGIPDVDLSRASPFGSLSQVAARRTYIYLIATLNASHPDYDFSKQLRPMDFVRETSLFEVMHTIDCQLQNLRPHKYPSPLVSCLTPLSYHTAPAVNNVGNPLWGNKMWSLIDREMDLRKCELYSYRPNTDPFDTHNAAIWSMRYFFYNKSLKRVCYLYLRALSLISYSPPNAALYVRARESARQRRDSRVSIGGSGAVEDDDDVISGPDDDEIEVPYVDLDDVRTGLADGYSGYYEDDMDYEEDDGYYADLGFQPISQSALDASEDIDFTFDEM